MSVQCIADNKENTSSIIIINHQHMEWSKDRKRMHSLYTTFHCSRQRGCNELTRCRKLRKGVKRNNQKFLPLQNKYIITIKRKLYVQFVNHLVDISIFFVVNVEAFDSYINNPIQLGSWLRHKWPARCCETQMQILNMNYRGCICPPPPLTLSSS